MATTNRRVTEYLIDKIWNLEDWNDKSRNLEGQFWIFALFFYYLFILF